MLDAVGDFDRRGEPEQAREILDKALGRTRTTIGELRDLSFNLEPVVLRDHGFTMAVDALAQDTRDRARDQDRRSTWRRRGARRADAGRAVPDRARGARGGDPSRAAAPVRGRGARRRAGHAESLIRDDAPTERRRRAIEVLEERARTLGANLTLDHDDRRHDDAPRTARPAHRRRVVFRAVNGDGASSTSSSSGSRPATSWWSRTVSRRRSAPRSSTRASSCA